MVDPSAPRRWWRRKRVILPALVVVGLLAPLPVSWMVHLAGWRAYDRAVAEARAAGLPTTMAEWAAQQPAFDEERTKRWLARLQPLVDCHADYAFFGRPGTSICDGMSWQQAPRVRVPQEAVMRSASAQACFAALRAELDADPPIGIFAQALSLALRANPPLEDAELSEERRLDSIAAAAALVGLHLGDPMPLMDLRRWFLQEDGADRRWGSGSRLSDWRDRTLLAMAATGRFAGADLEQMIAEPVPWALAPRDEGALEIIDIQCSLEWYRTDRNEISRIFGDLNADSPPWTWFGPERGGWLQRQWDRWRYWTLLGHRLADAVAAQTAHARRSSTEGLAPLRRKPSLLADGSRVSPIDFFDASPHMVDWHYSRHVLTRGAMSLIRACRGSATMPDPAGQAAWLKRDPLLPVTYSVQWPDRMRISLAMPLSATAGAMLRFDDLAETERIGEALAKPPDPWSSPLRIDEMDGFIDLRWPLPGSPGNHPVAAAATSGAMR